jgi:hypothetical protein
MNYMPLAFFSGRNLNSILKFLLGFFVYLSIHTGSFAQNKPLTILPFELKSDNRIYLKCKVNESDSLLFVFDTGAETMVINQNISGKNLTMNFDGEVDNIGTNGISKAPLSTKNSFSFGGISATDVSFISVPYGESVFDGVLGSTFMKKYIIEVDYRKKKMSFYDPVSYKYNNKEYEKLKVHFYKKIPLAEASVIINGKKYKGKYELDTGSDGSLMLSAPFVDLHGLTHQLKTVAHATASGSDGTKSISPIVVLPEMGIGGKHFYVIPAILSTAESGMAADKNLAGIVGNGFLKRFDMIIDMAHDKIYVKPNNLMYTPYYDFLVK